MDSNIYISLSGRGGGLICETKLYTCIPTCMHELELKMQGGLMCEGLMREGGVHIIEAFYGNYIMSYTCTCICFIIEYR